MNGPRRDAGLPATFAVDLRAANPMEGLRSGIAIASLVALAEWIHAPWLMAIALATWLTCLADPGGPLPNRLRAMAVFGLAGAVIDAGYGILLGHAPGVVTAALAGLGIFALSMLRAIGATGLQLGTVLCLVVVLGLRRMLTPGDAVAEVGLLFLAGAAWALLLTVLLWRLRPFQTARAAVGQAWQDLARLSADLRALLRRPGEVAEDWLRHARAHRRQVRASLEVARARALAHAEALRDAAGRLDPVWARLDAAEQVFDALVALPDSLGRDPAPPVRAAAAQLLDRLGPMLAGLATATARGAPAAPGGDLDRIAEIPGAEPLRPIVARLRRAFAQAAAPAIGDAAARPAPPAPPSPWTTLRAQLTPRSAVARHAARIGLAAGLATAATLPWPAGHAYWMTISLILTLQPDVAQTMARAAERMGGTFAGALLGAGLALLLPSPMAMAGVLLPLAATTAALRRVSYGVYVGGATAVIVVLLEVDHPGQAEALRIGLERAAYTLAGGGLALLAAIALWPDWAGERLDPVLRAAVAAHLRYAALGLAEGLGEADAATSLAVRREVGTTSADAEALLQRVLIEHVRARSGAFRAALAIDAALRRAGGQVAAMRLAGGATDEGAAAWRAWFDAAATAVAASRPLPAPPPGHADPVLADIAAQLTEAGEALAALGAAGSA